MDQQNTQIDQNISKWDYVDKDNDNIHAYDDKKVDQVEEKINSEDQMTNFV